MYIPRHFHWTFPVSVILLGFYLSQNYGQSYDVVIVFLSLNATALMHGMYIWRAGEMYQGYVTQSRPAVEPLVNWHTGQVIEEVPIRTEPKPKDDGFKPLIRVDGKVAYAQVTAQPKFDAERIFAKTLIDMRNHNFEVKMTEAYWIKEKRFSSSREEFVEMLDKWEHYGLSGRAGGQEKRVPKDWRKIRLIAQGEKLPPPPRKVL